VGKTICDQVTDVADPRAKHAEVRAADLGSEHECASRRRVAFGAEDGEQCRLPGTVLTEQGPTLTPLDGPVDGPENLSTADADADLRQSRRVRTCHAFDQCDSHPATSLAAPNREGVLDRFPSHLASGRQARVHEGPPARRSDRPRARAGRSPSPPNVNRARITGSFASREVHMGLWPSPSAGATHHPPSLGAARHRALLLSRTLLATRTAST
jgi:hypothetical protein